MKVADRMLRSELAGRIAAQHPHLSERNINITVDAILDQIIVAMTRGDRVELRGFGAFSVRDRPARVGRNPSTGVTISVPGKSMPCFKAGKEMRVRLNRNEHNLSA
jgi:integration host factor subunit beta